MPFMNLLTTLIINSLAVFASAYILPGVELDSIVTALVVAIVLGIVNTFIKPLLLLLTLPITFLTLGLFALVINAGLILLVSFIVPGFNVDGFLWALAFSLILSLINAFLNTLKG